MEQMLLVPVRSSAAGLLTVRTGRLPSGERIGLAFTSEDALNRTLGPGQWIHLAGDALTGMLAPLGIEHYRVDPDRVAQAARPGSQPWPPAVATAAQGRGRHYLLRGQRARQRAPDGPASGVARADGAACATRPAAAALEKVADYPLESGPPGRQ